MPLEPSEMLAAERAVDLGADLLRRGRTHLGSLIPKGERDCATAVDLEIETTIKRVLAEATSAIPFLGEEAGGASVEAPRLWVLDPIDGTVNFSKASPLCGISLALVEAGRPTFGIVDLPLLGERYVAAAGAGAFLNGRRIAVADTGDLRQAVIGFADFAVDSHADAENRIHRELMRRLARESLRVRVHGSACLDLAWLAVGRLSADGDALEPSLGRRRRGAARPRGRRRGLRLRRLRLLVPLAVHAGLGAGRRGRVAGDRHGVDRGGRLLLAFAASVRARGTAARPTTTPSWPASRATVPRAPWSGGR